MQVDGLDPVSLQDRQEEGGERWQQDGEDGEEEERLRRWGQSVPRRTAVLDAGGAPLIVPAPDHLSDGLEVAAAIDAGVEQGRRQPRRSCGRPRRSNGPARCHGSGRGRVAARRLEARKIWMCKIFKREVAAVVCCGKEEGAFSAKFLRGRPGRGFRSVGLDATV
jgi:hypothetical protein